MSSNYGYLRFGIMPYQLQSNIVSPNRPLKVGKKVYRVDHYATETIPAGGELEIVCMEGYVAGANSEPIALFYAVQSNQTSVFPDKSHANKRTLSNKPNIVDHATCYIGGFMKIEQSSGSGPVTFEGKTYEPTTNNNPVGIDDVPNTGPTASKTFNLTNGTAVFASCMPCEVKSKRFYQLNYPDFHRMSYHMRIRNNSSSTVNINIIGAWWLETHEATGASPYPFVQDIKCPSKLAEYVFGYLKSSKTFIHSTNVASEFANLDATITTALTVIVNSWQVLTSNITLQQVINNTSPVEVKETDADWAAKPLIWNP